MNTVNNTSEVVTNWRKLLKCSLRQFAYALAEKTSYRVSGQAVHLWETGETKPSIYQMTALLFQVRDWRADFVMDVLSTLDSRYDPATEIGRKAREHDGNNHSWSDRNIDSDMGRA